MVFGGEEIDAKFRKILGHSVNHDGLGIPDPWLSLESAYSTSKVAIRELVGYLLGGTTLNHVCHRDYVCGDVAIASKEQTYAEMAEIDR